MHGIIPALLTAYTPDGEIDTVANNRVVDKLINDGVNGFFIDGTTGEALLHTVDERKHLVSSMVEHIGGRVTTIAHVGALSTDTTLELARFASDLHVDAIAAVTPVYYHLSPQSHADYFRRLAEVASVPLIAYHIPSRSGVHLPTEWFAELAEEGVIQGVKYTSTDLYQFAEIRRLVPEGTIVYNGSDEVLLGGLALGADGGIGSTYNAIAPVYLELYRAFQAGDIEAARTQQHIANHFIDAMNDYDFIAFLREVLREQDLEIGISREPLPHLTAQQTEAVRQLITGDTELRAATRITEQRTTTE